jgi:hypothetical protein
MHTNRIFYSFLICISFGLKSVLTLDKVENRAALWYNSYVKDLDPAQQLELYNGLSDLGTFSSYAILSEKNYSDIARLVAALNTATVEEEARILKALSFLIKEAVTQYPIKIEYEARVEACYQKWEKNTKLKEALNACFSDLRSFTQEEGTEHSSLFVTQLQKTRVDVLRFALILENLQQQIQDKDAIVKTEFEDDVLPYYYACRKVLETDIHQFMVEGVGIQRLLNEIILFYIDTIIKKIAL